MAETLALVELQEKQDAYVKTLSGGQKQRLSLACALVGDPELLFLDEPTTGLDPQSRRQTWGIVEALKARGRTVLLTTHYMEEAARLCDRVAIVDHGKLIALGTPRELIASLGAEHVIEFAVEDGRAAARRRRCARSERRGRGARGRALAPHRARGAPHGARAAGRAGRAGRSGLAPHDAPRHAGGRVRGPHRPHAARWLRSRDVPVRHPLVELTLARVRELVREPEAVFWVFVFPILLAGILGLAFRSRPPDALPVAVVEGSASAARLAALRAEPSLRPEVLAEPEARAALGRGRVVLVVSAGEPPAYPYDPTQPESRAARLAVDAALQRAAGRADAFTAGAVEITEPGARYVDFLVPGLLGMNLMGTGMWGVGFSLVVARNGKLLKRLVAAPAKRRICSAPSSSRA